MKISPDMTRVTLSVEGKYPEYGETLRRSAEETEQLRNMLSEFGFEPTDLKTLSFNVDTEFESYKDRGTYKQRFVGYKFRHVMKIEFGKLNNYSMMSKRPLVSISRANNRASFYMHEMMKTESAY